MVIELAQTLRLVMLYYFWVLRSNRTSFLALQDDRERKIGLDVIGDVYRIDRECKVAVFDAQKTRAVEKIGALYNLIAVIDPKDAFIGLEFDEVHTPQTPVLVLTRSTSGLRREDVIKTILHHELADKVRFILVMNEEDSSRCRDMLQRSEFLHGKFEIYTSPSVVSLLFVYICLFFLVMASLTIMYILVSVYSEKDPICLPGTLERCPISVYSLIRNKEMCQRCMICLDEFNEKDECRILGCGHFFHTKCVDPWLEYKSSRCPLCSQHLDLAIEASV